MNKEEFFIKILEFFPYKEEEFLGELEYYGELLSTVFIEDIFMSEIINLLKEDKEVDKLTDIFNYFEDVVNFGNDELVNIFSVTALEVLGNDRNILATARKYMGAKTIEEQILADKGIGRVVD